LAVVQYNLDSPLFFSEECQGVFGEPGRRCNMPNLPCGLPQRQRRMCEGEPTYVLVESQSGCMLACCHGCHSMRVAWLKLSLLLIAVQALP
jgi:hypothetical protein